MTAADEVEAAFRRYLDAAAWLKDMTAIADDVAVRVANPEVEVTEGRFELRRLEVVRGDDREAEVLLDATTRTRGRHRTIGEIDFKLRFKGPATARRRAGSWIVTDVTEDGRRRSESIRPLAGTVSAGPVRLEPVSVNLGGTATRLAVRVTNDGDEPLLLTDALVGTRIWSLPWRYRQVAIVQGREAPPRSVADALLSWRAIPLSVREFRLVIKAAGLRTAAAFSAHLRIRPRDGSVEEVARLPAQVRSQSVESALRLAPFVPPVVLTAAHQYLAAAVVTLVEVGALVALLARARAKRWITNRHLALGLFFSSVWAVAALVLLAWTR